MPAMRRHVQPIGGDSRQSESGMFRVLGDGGAPSGAQARPWRDEHFFLLKQGFRLQLLHDSSQRLRQ